MSKKRLDLSKYPHIPLDRAVVIQDCYAISQSTDEPDHIRGYFHAILQMLLSGEAQTEDIISAAKQLGYRLSEYDGDEVGRPADDEWSESA